MTEISATRMFGATLYIVSARCLWEICLENHQDAVTINVCILTFIAGDYLWRLGLKIERIMQEPQEYYSDTDPQAQ